MPCCNCHEEYRGLAGDCACTMYGYSDEAEFRREAPEREVRAYERMHPPVMPPNQIVRETLYRFCQGMKVAVEITLMSADAGLINISKEIIAIAGSDEGADTALVLKPAYSGNFTDLKIKEILAKPR